MYEIIVYVVVVSRYNGNVHDRFPIDSQLNWTHSGHYSTVNAITSNARLTTQLSTYSIHVAIQSYLCVSKNVNSAASATIYVLKRSFSPFYFPHWTCPRIITITLPRASWTQRTHNTLPDIMDLRHRLRYSPPQHVNTKRTFNHI